MFAGFLNRTVVNLLLIGIVSKAGLGRIPVGDAGIIHIIGNPESVRFVSVQTINVGLGLRMLEGVSV
jgi:hypothetical protein